MSKRSHQRPTAWQFQPCNSEERISIGHAALMMYPDWTAEAVSNSAMLMPASRGTAFSSRYDRYRTFIMVFSGKETTRVESTSQLAMRAAQERLWRVPAYLTDRPVQHRW
jgi:hypothetical protein